MEGQSLALLLVVLVYRGCHGYTEQTVTIAQNDPANFLCNVDNVAATIWLFAKGNGGRDVETLSHGANVYTRFKNKFTLEMLDGPPDNSTSHSLTLKFIGTDDEDEGLYLCKEGGITKALFNLVIESYTEQTVTIAENNPANFLCNVDDVATTIWLFTKINGGTDLETLSQGADVNTGLENKFTLEMLDGSKDNSTSHSLTLKFIGTEGDEGLYLCQEGGITKAQFNLVIKSDAVQNIVIAEDTPVELSCNVNNVSTTSWYFSRGNGYIFDFISHGSMIYAIPENKFILEMLDGSSDSSTSLTLKFNGTEEDEGSYVCWEEQTIKARFHLVVETKVIGCRTGYTYFEFSCYKYEADPVPFEKAREMCQNEGGNLTSVTTEEENTFVGNLTGGQRSWIGGVRSKTDVLTTRFRWVSGEPWGFTSWKKREPNNSGGREHCIEIIFRRRARWNDHRCQMEKPYVCEIPFSII